MATGVHHVGGPGLPEVVAFLNLAVVVAIIYFAGRRGIKASVAQRSLDIAKNLTVARDELLAVEARLKKAKHEYSALDAKKREVIESVRTEGERVAKQILEETQKSADQILSDAELSAKSEIRNAAKKIRSSLVEQTFTQALSQLQGSTASAESSKSEIHDKLFEKFVAEIPSQLKNVGGLKNGA